MTLFFRLNVLSGKLNSFRYACMQSLPRSLVCQYRGILTNVSGVKLNKSKDHDFKIIQCTDIEKYFKKVKKGDSDKKQSIKGDDAHWDKRNGDRDNRQKTSTSPATSIFHHDDQKCASHSKASDNNNTSNRSQFFVKFINEGSANQTQTSHHLKAPPQQQNYSKTMEGTQHIPIPTKHETKVLTRNGVTDVNIDKRKNYLWIALVAASLCGISTLFWLQNSKQISNGFSTSTDVSKKVASHDLNTNIDVSNKDSKVGTSRNVSEKSFPDNENRNIDVSNEVSSNDVNKKINVSNKLSSTATNTTNDGLEYTFCNDVSKKVNSYDLSTNIDIRNKDSNVGANTSRDVSEKFFSNGENTNMDVSEKVCVLNKASSDDTKSSNDALEEAFSNDVNTSTDVSTKVSSHDTNVSDNVSSSTNINTSNGLSEKVFTDNMNTSTDAPSENVTTISGASKQQTTTCLTENLYKVPYVIIGGGTSAVSAYRSITKRVPNAKVLIITNESYPPYIKPPLSKELWFTENSNNVAENIYFEPNDFYVDPIRLLNEEISGVAILNGCTAKRLNICDRKVILSDGTEIEYDECLLAIGAKPQNLLIFRSAPIRIRNKISSLMNIDDFQRLKEIVDQSESIAVIGGGFVASEISFALAKYAGGDRKKFEVYQIFHEDGNMGTSLPKYLSEWVKNKLSNCGVFIIPNTQVESVKMEQSKLKLGLLNGKLVVVNHVIVALGSQPDVRFAKLSGLRVNSSNNGIIVNEYLQAGPHMYVAGDAASLPDKLGKETEKSQDHATASGQLAGENMTGLKKPFTNQSMFWSNIGQQVSFESVGLIDAALKTVGVFSQDSQITMNGTDLFTLKEDGKAADDRNKGIIFYLEKDKVVGIVLWNVFNKINLARQVIAEGKNMSEISEVAKLFEIQ